MIVRKAGPLLKPNCSRVLLRPFNPNTEERACRIVDRALSLPESAVSCLVTELDRDFSDRHRRYYEFLLNRFMYASRYLRCAQSPLSKNRRLLIGAYFTQEYAPESAALFNPSIVWHPDQSGLDAGSKRFILSLRATGEGHISSICFRTGVIGSDDGIALDDEGPFIASGAVVPDASFDRHLFTWKLRDIGISNKVLEDVFSGIGELFTTQEIEGRLKWVEAQYRATTARARSFDRARDQILTLAQSNYEVRFEADQPLAERVLFPTAPTERNGIEDARFVRFTDSDSERYFATYTAYNGATAVPQLIETDDFLHFKMSTLNGSDVQNKGMALFPRRIGGKYAMLSRQDNENIYIMFSDHLHFWSGKEQIVCPVEPWEFVQVGNCGSPIETERGWLVLSHGVGAMRRYVISAFLLDLADPRKVIGRLREPLLVAQGVEREGYVPNVVYSCGAVLNGGSLVIPYAVSDYATSFAVTPLNEVLDGISA